MACKVEILTVIGKTSSDGVLHTIHVEGRIVDPTEDDYNQRISLDHLCYKTD